MSPEDGTPPQPLPEAPAPQPSVPERPHKPLRHKKLLLAVPILLLLLFAAGFWLSRSNQTEDTPADTTQQAEPTELKAAVTLIDGQAEYSADGQTWESLEDDLTLEQGAFVRTKPDSRVVLTLDDGSAIRLNHASTVRLTSLAVKDVQLTNQAGEVYTRVVESDRDFAVAVGSDVYAAQGTAYTTVNTPATKGVLVYQSQVALAADDTAIDEGKQYYTQHSNANLAKKVSDIPVAQLKKDAFAKWNLEQDKTISQFENRLGFLTNLESDDAQPDDENQDETPANSIRLSGKAGAKGVQLEWAVVGLSGMEGFKIVYSKDNQTPTFGKDSSHYAEGATARSTSVNLNDGQTYYFRACSYRANKCSNYSNAVQIKAPYTAPKPVKKGAVTLAISGNALNWTFTGTAPHGFKVLVSKSPLPVYPKHSYLFVGAGKTSASVQKLGNGTHYIRVCKYTADDKISGGCTDYSNQMTLTKP